MDIEKLIKIEICQLIISKLEEDILYKFENFTYGSYKISEIYLNLDDYYIKKQDLGKIKVEVSRILSNAGATRYEEIFSIEIKRNKKTFKNYFHLFQTKTEYDILIDKIYNLLLERIDAKNRQKEYGKNAKLVEFLPTERKIQFLREQKLNRIIK